MAHLAKKIPDLCVGCMAKPSWCWDRVWCGITDSDIFRSFRFQ